MTKAELIERGVNFDNVNYFSLKEGACAKGDTL